MNRTANPAMLILARESRGLTQSELAEALGVTQGKISKYESGMLEVSADQLKELVKALDYPAEFFSQLDPVLAAGSSCLHHRKRQSMPVNELKRIHAVVNIVRMHMNRLLRGAEIESQGTFPRMDVEDYPGGPEEIARLVRKTWKLKQGPIDHVVNAIEDAGGVVYRWPFGTRKLDAISQWVPGSPPLFFVNAESPTDRMRFSLAHELGHVVMHCSPTPDQEREADRFAAEFLMPASEIRPQLRPLSIQKAAALKPYWKASMAAIIKRAFDLEVISNGYYRKLFTQLSKLGYRTNEPSLPTMEEPSILQDFIRIHLVDHNYSVPELSRHVRLHEREFREYYMPQHRLLRLANAN